MLNRRNFLKAAGISLAVLPAGKLLAEVPKSDKYNIDIHSFPCSEVRRRLRRMVRMARIYPKNAHKFMIHLNWQDSEELIADFDKAGFTSAYLTDDFTFYLIDIKWYCDTDISVVMTKAPLRGHSLPEINTSTKRLTLEECKLFCQKMRDPVK